MEQQQGIVKGDAPQKIGSAGFIIGAILYAVGGLLLPHAANPSNLQEMLQPLGEQEFLTQFSTLLITIGIWAWMIGTAGVYRSITAGGAVWSQLGFYFIIVGTALWTVSLAGDIAIASAAANWLAAPTNDQEAAYSVVAAVSAFGRGVDPLTLVVNWLAFAFLSIGMVRSALYPRWLGWVGLIQSVPVIAVGIIQIFTARSITLTLIFMGLSFLTTLWVFALGIWVARKAW